MNVGTERCSCGTFGAQQLLNRSDRVSIGEYYAGGPGEIDHGKPDLGGGSDARIGPNRTGGCESRDGCGEKQQECFDVAEHDGLHSQQVASHAVFDFGDFLGQASLSRGHGLSGIAIPSSSDLVLTTADLVGIETRSCGGVR